jgi:hypothetical protein
MNPASHEPDSAPTDEPLVAIFETGDPTAMPIAEALLREADIAFTWKDIGLSAARQGGGYQLYGATLYQLLVLERDRTNAIEAIADLEHGSDALTEESADESSDVEGN